jgi:hypothetical protein
MSVALAASEDFRPEDEFSLRTWIDLDLGALDLSINKAVVYLAEAASDRRRVAIRARPEPDRRGKPPVEGDRTVVPVRGGAVPLHLGHQHRQLHSAADL